jgi:hypothetical protein
MSRTPNNLTPADLQETARKIREKVQKVENLKQELEKAEDDLRRAEKVGEKYAQSDEDTREAKEKANAHRIEKAQERVQSLQQDLELAESRLEKLRSKGQVQRGAADSEIGDLHRNQGVLSDLDIESAPDAQSNIDRASRNQDRHEQEWRSAREELNKALDEEVSVPDVAGSGAFQDFSSRGRDYSRRGTGSSGHQWGGTQQERIWGPTGREKTGHQHKHLEDFHIPHNPDQHPGQFETLESFEDGSEIGWADEGTSLGNMHVKDDGLKATVEFFPNWEEEDIDSAFVMEQEDGGHVLATEDGEVAKFEGEQPLEGNPVDPMRPGPSGPDYRDRLHDGSDVVDMSSGREDTRDIDPAAIYDEVVEEVRDASFDPGELTDDVPTGEDPIQTGQQANSISYPDYLPSEPPAHTYGEGTGYVGAAGDDVLPTEAPSTPDYDPVSNLDFDPGSTGTDPMRDSIDTWREALSESSAYGEYGDYSIGDGGDEMGISNVDLSDSPFGYDGYEPMYDIGDGGWGDIGGDGSFGGGGYGGGDPYSGGGGYGSGPGGGEPGLPGGPF